jgi:hypothetical protein
VSNEWERRGEREPQLLHRHPDGPLVRTDRTLPFLTDEPSVAHVELGARRWRSTFVCRECAAKRVEEWPD